jgi:hypothetical protein
MFNQITKFAGIKKNFLEKFSESRGIANPAGWEDVESFGRLLSDRPGSLWPIRTSIQGLLLAYHLNFLTN